VGAACPRGRSHLSALRLDRETLPTWLFGAAVAVTGPLLLFHYGAYHWFLRDEWQFFSERDGLVHDLFSPHGGSHLVAVPRAVYLGMWELFGLRSYRPYQALVVGTHLAIAVLLFAVIRRSGVRPWLAFAPATLFVLVGPGAVNAVWAFQIGFNGSLAWGLAQLLLADHDGPPSRRDAVGLLCGLLAILSSGVGASVIVGVAVAVLLRRGWKMAALHSVPLAVLYGGWALVAGATTSTTIGRPTPRVLLDWVRSSLVGTFLELGHFQVLTWLLLAVLVVGMALVWGPGRVGTIRATAARLSMPIGLLVAAPVFAATTGLGRWWLGDQGARGERYVYLGAVLVLPILAVAAEAIAERWRALTPALVALFLIPVPANLTSFGTGVFGERYMDARRSVITTAVRMPFAHDVPRDVQPVPDPFSGEDVSIGFLLDAVEDGKLEPSTTPITPTVENEFRVRLGVAQRISEGTLAGCRTYDEALRLEPEVGDQLYLGSDVGIATQEDGRRTTRPVQFRPDQGGTQLTIELPDLDLVVVPGRNASRFTLCESG
jgi:hypothetical protein